MIDARVVKTFHLCEDRAKKLDLVLSAGHENFAIQNTKGQVLCFTPIIEAVQCFLDAAEYYTEKS